MRFYHFLTKISWDGIVELVCHGGKEGAEDVIHLVSSHAWLEIGGADWIPDLRNPVFSTVLTCDYELLLSRILKGYHIPGNVSVSAA
jgi:hypothetical protein